LAARQGRTLAEKQCAQPWESERVDIHWHPSEVSVWEVAPRGTSRGHRLEALFSVALALGLRQGEALGLRWEDIDFNAGTLRVSHQLQRIDGRLTLVPPKTLKAKSRVVGFTLTTHGPQPFVSPTGAGRTAAGDARSAVLRQDQRCIGADADLD
jgi:hypothetical protein